MSIQRKDYSQNYYQLHRQDILTAVKQRAQSPEAKEHKRQYFHQYYQRPEVKAKRREWARNHRPYRRQYYKRNPQRFWAYETLKRHQHAGYNILLTSKDLIELAAKTIFCPFCGCKLDWGYKGTGYASQCSPSIDRINNGDTISKDNIMIICHRCNIRKSDSTLEEFISYCKQVAEKWGGSYVNTKNHP